MSPIRMSRLETAVRVVLEFKEAFNRHDVAAMVQLISDDCVFEHSGPTPDGMVYLGKEAIHQFLQNWFLGSPQARLQVEEIFGLAPRCVMRWRCDWVDGTGNRRHVRGVDILKVKNGLICEKLSYVKG